MFAGTYNVTVTNPASGCTARKTAVVTSNFATPMVSTSVGSQLTCVNAAVQIFASANPSTVTYSWTGPAGYTSMVQNPTVNAAGTYTVTVRSTVNGCTATATATVVSNTAPPGATAVGGIKTCSNPVVTILATSPTSGVTFKWSGPGGFNSTLPNPSVSTTGAYSVTITNPVNGCTSVSVHQCYAKYDAAKCFSNDCDHFLLHASAARMAELSRTGRHFPGQGLTGLPPISQILP